MDRPKTRYARSGDFSIAYQVIGDGPLNLVHIPGLVSHLDAAWANPKYVRFMERLASFARVVVYDKRGCGLSDPVADPPAVEDRIDDIRAVMDAAGIGSGAVFGCSEGATLAVYFAASYPERTRSAVLYGSFARIRPDPPDHPWGFDDEVIDTWLEGIAQAWGEGVSLTMLAPSLLADEREREWWGTYERAAMSPRSVQILMEANRELDLRDVLPAVRVPTLVLHRSGDLLPRESARYVAEHIPEAKFIELDGDDHWPWVGDPDQVCDHVEEFLTGTRQPVEADRVLATVLFTDIVGSTDHATRLGDRRWTELLGEHERRTRLELERYKGKEVKTTGDGFLAAFDGPARAIRCANAVAARVRELGLELRAGVHTGECELRGSDLGGIAVHIGARVMEAANPGEVLVSSTVRDLTVGSEIVFDDRGEHRLKGVPRDWQLFAARV